MTSNALSKGRNYPFAPYARPSEFAHETQDCTVRALAVCLEMSYADAHKRMKEHGRVDCRPFASYDAYTAIGLRALDIQAEGSRVSRYAKRRTIGQWLKSKELPSRCILRIRGHVFAVVNGVVHDTGSAPVYSGNRVTRVFIP